VALSHSGAGPAALAVIGERRQVRSTVIDTDPVA
jgi:hypothetical protein